jgi:hypothetical protein
MRFRRGSSRTPIRWQNVKAVIVAPGVSVEFAIDRRVGAVTRQSFEHRRGPRR